MLIKYTLITVIVSIMFAIYLHEYHTRAFTSLKLSATNFYADFIVWTFSCLGLEVFTSWKQDSALSSLPVSRGPQKEKLFTESELSKCTGSEENKKLYLAILGKVYDVGSGKKHYGPGGAYHFFTGRDASRAFVTGDFSETGLTDDVLGLTPKELKSILEWDKFYRKEYQYKGKLIGRYYDTNGKNTPYYVWLEHMVEEARREEESESNDKLLFPPCNMEWSQESGSRVWCSNMSGGIEREWVGVPRQLYIPSSKSYRCSCVNTDHGAVSTALLREYPDCDSKSTSCNIIDT